jgi:hypothetical protein
MNLPHKFLPEFPLGWEMSAAEQFVLAGVLERLRPEVALEIGTFQGGSLQVLSRFAGTVFSIDSDPRVQERLAPLFPGVRFHIGPSRDMIPAAFARMRDSGMRLGFALVDGDHSAAGVRDDVELILRLAPADALHILIHDSYNPDCRRGLRAVRWEEFPEVRLVDLDFVPGGFHSRARGGAFARSMWGGFARIETLPGRREGSILFGDSQQEQHDIVFRHSAHRLWHKVLRRFRSLPRR